MKFADAGADYNTAKFIIFGIPHEDREMSFRSGTGLAPAAVRSVSYNYESFHFESGVDLSSVALHDAGDIRLEDAPGFVSRVFKEGKIPVAIGGAHSITPHLVSSINSINEDFGVLILDAHMDFRTSYLGSEESHACTARRIFEKVGKERIISAGVRSASRDEMEDARKLGFIYHGVSSIRNLADRIEFRHIYLSIDMDVFDPSLAPGVSNPEPFGAGYEVFEFVGALAERIIAMDVVETCPPYDDGRTSLLAAALVRELIARSKENQSATGISPP